MLGVNGKQARRIAILAALLLTQGGSILARARHERAHTGEGFACGTGAARQREVSAREKYLASLHTNRRAIRTRLEFLPAATGGADIGDVAVVEDDGTVVSPVNPFDLAGHTIRFVPSGPAGYEVEILNHGLTDFAGTELLLEDDGSRPVVIEWGFPFYGAVHTMVFVNSDGNITLGEPDNSLEARDTGRFLAHHPRVAALFADLDPSGGGSVLVRGRQDSLKVVWHGVPGHGSLDTNSFGIQLFRDGTIEMSYGVDIGVRDAIVGISPGDDGAAVNAFDFSAPANGYIAGAMLEVFASETRVSETALSRLFLKQHPDDFDHIVAFLGFDEDLDGSYAYEVNVMNEIDGIGLGRFDNSAIWGSRGRLRSFVMMGSLDGPGRYPSDPLKVFLGTNNTITILAHESGHRWLAYADFSDAGEASASILGRQRSHWSFFLNSGGSVMEGNEIEDRGASLGAQRFVTTGATRTYSSLDQYLMGFVGPEAVPSLMLVENPVGTSRTPASGPAVGVTFGGTPRSVTVNQIIEANGPRGPSVHQSPKVLRQAFVLLVRKGEAAKSSQVQKVQRIRDEWVSFVRRETSGRAWVVTDLTPHPGIETSELVLPLLREDRNHYTAVVFSNWGLTPADILVTALDRNGAPVQKASVNPRVLTVAPGAQAALPAVAMNGLEYREQAEGWLRATATSSRVVAYAVEGDIDGRLSGGLPAASRASATLYFTGSLCNGGCSSCNSTLRIVNPNRDSTELEFSLVDARGNCTAKASRALAAGAELAETAATLFDLDASGCEGYVRVHASSPVTGFQTTGAPGPEAVAVARRPAGSAKLYAPQFASGRFGSDRYSTEIGITNASGESRTVSIQLRGNDGAVIASLANGTPLQLAPGQQLRAEGAGLFGLPDPAWTDGGIEGSVVLIADGPGIIGEVRISDPARRLFETVMPMQDGTSADIIIPHLVQGASGDGRYFTGLALQNPASGTVEVSVRAIADSGETTGLGTIVLGPHARMSGTLPGLIPGLEQQSGGYLRITSTGLPIAACAVIGSQELAFLSAVPAELVLENGTSARLK
jgi:hypothetical protein